MIRPYTDPDLEDLLDTWEAASAVAHPFLSPEFLDQERVNIPNLYLPNTETWVAEMDDCVVGFVALMGNEVGALFVHPDHHRSGIGHALIEKARKLRGELQVEVFTNNQIGRGFYAKQGFELINVKTHDQTGFEVMRLRLPAPS
ncbi:MAG: GNAT family N-acetyltransferase [Planctomycetaceae bacterium]|nr:GNAT family N-acetyltransferase [Planctomycetaceae bacterium]